MIPIAGLGAVQGRLKAALPKQSSATLASWFRQQPLSILRALEIRPFPEACPLWKS
jgi:hypothetical protein